MQTFNKKLTLEWQAEPLPICIRVPVNYTQSKSTALH